MTRDELYRRVPDVEAWIPDQYERDEQAERDAALGEAVRKAVEADDPQPSGFMATEIRELVMYSRDPRNAYLARDDDWIGNVMLAIADALEKERQK